MLACGCGGGWLASGGWFSLRSAVASSPGRLPSRRNPLRAAAECMADKCFDGYPRLLRAPPPSTLAIIACFCLADVSVGGAEVSIARRGLLLVAAPYQDWAPQTPKAHAVWSSSWRKLRFFHHLATATANTARHSREPNHSSPRLSDPTQTHTATVPHWPASALHRALTNTEARHQGRDPVSRSRNVSDGHRS